MIIVRRRIVIIFIVFKSKINGKDKEEFKGKGRSKGKGKGRGDGRVLFKILIRRRLRSDQRW